MKISWIICPDCKNANCTVVKDGKIIKSWCEGQFSLFGD